MAQFDVLRNPRGGSYPLVVDVQADVLERLATRVVVPMTRARKEIKPIRGLNPIANVQGVEYVLLFQELAAVARAELGPKVGTLAARRSELIAALDLLITGA
jgi:toxin CcdB